MPEAHYQTFSKGQYGKNTFNSVSVFIPSFYENTLYALSHIPAEVIHVYVPKLQYDSILAKRMRVVNLAKYRKIVLNYLPIRLFPADPVKLVRGNYTLNSLWRFDENSLEQVHDEVLITAEPHTLYSYQISKFAKKNRRALVVMTEADPSLSVYKLLPYALFARYVLKSADAIGSSTPLSDSYVLPHRKEGVFRAHISAPIVVDPRSKTFDEFRLLFVGRLDESKGILVLVKALNELSRSYDFRLDIVGEGPLKGALAEATFMYMHYSFLPREELEELYRNDNIYVQPSQTVKLIRLIRVWSEVFGLAFLEAMGHGMATIASDCGNLRYAQQDKRAIFHEGDYKGLVKVLSELLKDEARLKENARMNREYVEREFSAEALETKWRRLLEHVGR